MNPVEAAVIRRILVAVDASAPSLAVLEAAAQIAAGMHAELAGLFVEDEDLLRLAGLPFARAYSAAAADLAAMDPAVMERALRVQAARARHAVEQAARRRRVAWSFSVARGALADALAEAARACDVLGVGKAGPGAPRRALGGTARQVMARSGCALLVLQRDGTLGRRVAALYTGGEAALAVAAGIARNLGLTLEILAAAPDEAAAGRLALAAEAWLAAQGVTGRVAPAVGDPVALARVAEARGRALVVAAPAGLLAGEGAVEALAAALDSPLLLVR